MKVCFRVYLKIVDVKDPIAQKEERCRSAIVASGGCELQVNCFVFHLEVELLIWGGSRRGAWALDPAAYSADGVSLPMAILGKGPLSGLFNQSSWQPGAQSGDGREGELCKGRAIWPHSHCSGTALCASINIICKLVSTAVSESESGVITRLLDTLGTLKYLEQQGSNHKWPLCACFLSSVLLSVPPPPPKDTVPVPQLVLCLLLKESEFAMMT